MSKLTSASEISEKPTIQCQLDASSPQSLANAVWVNYKITNVSERSISVLPWFTPLEGFNSNLFDITNERDERVVYQGRLIKRASPQSDDYIVLASGESMQTKLNLLLAYHLAPGLVHVTLAKPFITELMTNQIEKIWACPTHRVEIMVMP